MVALLVGPLVMLVNGSATALDNGRIPAGGVLRVSVAEAIGGKTVVGQLTVDRVVGAGFVTAYGCDDDIPRNPDGTISRSDLNFDGSVSPVSSNRLIVKADNSGDVCFFTMRPAALIVDINGVTFDTGVNSFANRRCATRVTCARPTAQGRTTCYSIRHVRSTRLPLQARRTPCGAAIRRGPQQSMPTRLRIRHSHWRWPA